METVCEIIELLKNSFPTLPYFYDGDDGLWHFVYLGGNKRKRVEKLPYSYAHKHLFFTLGGMYENRPLSDDGMILVARTFKKLITSCDSRQAGIFSIEEQERYLLSLSENELAQIAEQVKIYLFCREAYDGCYRKPRPTEITE